MRLTKMIFAAVAVALIFTACQSAPVVKEVSTEAERAVIDSAKKGLEVVPGDSRHIGPRDSARIEYAKTALDVCSGKLLDLEKNSNACATSLAALSSELTKTKTALKETSDRLSEYKSKVRWSFLGEIESFMKGAVAGILFSIIAAAVLYFTGLFAKGLDTVRRLIP